MCICVQVCMFCVCSCITKAAALKLWAFLTYPRLLEMQLAVEFLGAVASKPRSSDHGVAGLGWNEVQCAEPSPHPFTLPLI